MPVHWAEYVWGLTSSIHFFCSLRYEMTLVRLRWQEVLWQGRGECTEGEDLGCRSLKGGVSMARAVAGGGVSCGDDGGEAGVGRRHVGCLGGLALYAKYLWKL